MIAVFWAIEIEVDFRGFDWDLQEGVVFSSDDGFRSAVAGKLAQLGQEAAGKEDGVTQAVLVAGDGDLLSAGGDEVGTHFLHRIGCQKRQVGEADQNSGTGWLLDLAGSEGDARAHAFGVVWVLQAGDSQRGE